MIHTSIASYLGLQRHMESRQRSACLKRGISISCFSTMNPRRSHGTHAGILVETCLATLERRLLIRGNTHGRAALFHVNRNLSGQIEVSGITLIFNNTIPSALVLISCFSNYWLQPIK